MISTERVEIMCGIIVMLYINKYGNYDLNWEVITSINLAIWEYKFQLHSHRILWFSYGATESTTQRRFSLRRDRCLHSTVVTEQTTSFANAKVQIVTNRFLFLFFFFFLLLSLRFVRERLSRIFDLFP